MQSIAIICNQLQSYAYAINCNVFHRMQIPGAASQGLAKRNSLAWSSRRGVSKSLCRRRPLWGQPDSIRDWAMDAGARRISTPTVPNLNPLRTLQRFEMVWNGLRWFENVWNDLKKRWFEEAGTKKVRGGHSMSQPVTATKRYKSVWYRQGTPYCRRTRSNPKRGDLVDPATPKPIGKPLRYWSHCRHQTTWAQEVFGWIWPL